MKKLLIIGVISIVILGCVLAAGCTSNTSTTTTTEDFAVGTWTLPNGTMVVFGNDFKGVMTTGDKTFTFTWKKTADGKYQVDREDGTQVLWTLDNVKGTMTNAEGAVLSKQTSDISGTVKYDQIRMEIYGKDLIRLGEGEGRIQKFYKAKNFSSDPDYDYCLGYYTEPEGGVMILNREFNIANKEIPGYVESGKWAYNHAFDITHPLKLYGHYSDEPVDQD